MDYNSQTALTLESAHVRITMRARLIAVLVTMTALTTVTTVITIHGNGNGMLTTVSSATILHAFRLGSGAGYGPVTTTSETEAYLLKSPNTASYDVHPRQLTPAIKSQRANYLKSIIVCIGILGYLCSMMPGGRGDRGGGPMNGGGGGNFNYRIPPAWSPEREESYSFRAWVTDLHLWTLLTDLRPEQQAAAIIMRLEGSARECARTLTQQEITQGGVMNGVNHGPVAYIVAGLEMRFAQLADETRLAAMNEFMAFARYPNERINQLLNRYEIVRTRAAREGNFGMSIEGCALQLLRVCHVNPQQLVQFLQPYGGRLPTTEQEFRDLLAHMRRIGHILEHSPNNIAAAIQGGRQAPRGAYHTNHLQSAWSGTRSDNTQSFFGSNGYGTGWNPAEAVFETATPGGNVDSTDWAYLTGHGPSGYPPPQQNSWYPQQPPPPVPRHMTYMGAEDSGTDDPPDMVESSSNSGASTDTETSSDSGGERIDMSDVAPMNENDAAEHIFLQYRHAKRKWRRFAHKPVRRFRRVIKRFQKHKFRRMSSHGGHRRRFQPSSGGFGGGRGGYSSGPRHSRRGHSRPWRNIFVIDEANAYLKGRGKGHRKDTSGKGHGRSGNPKGRDGAPLKCHNCGSTEHLKAKCPQGGANSHSSGGASSAPPPPAFYGEQPHSAAEPNWSWGQFSFAGVIMEEEEASYTNSATQSSPRRVQPNTATGSIGGPLDGIVPTNESNNIREQAFMISDSSGSILAEGVVGNAGVTNYDPVFARNTDPWPSQGMPEHLRPQPTQPTPEPSNTGTSWSSWQRVTAPGARDEQLHAVAAVPMTPNNQETGATATGRWDNPYQLNSPTQWAQPGHLQASSPEFGAVATNGFLNNLISGGGFGETMMTNVNITEPTPRTAVPAPGRWAPSTESVPPWATPADTPAGLLERFLGAGSILAEGAVPMNVAPPSMPNPFIPRSTPEAEVLATPVDSGAASNIRSLWTGASVFAAPALGAQNENPMESPLWNTIQAINENNQRQVQGHAERATPSLRPLFGNVATNAVVGSNVSSDSEAPSMPTLEAAPPPRRVDVVPVIFDGNNLTCTICDQLFAAGERVCRLRCRHIFHTECWDRYMTHTNMSTDQFHGDCPNCRGRGDVIAIWNFIDPELVTQYGPNGVQVSNDLGVEQSIEMTTPRSMVTDYPFGTPQSHPTPTPVFGSPNSEVPTTPPLQHSGWDELHLAGGTHHTQGRNYIILPSTYWDAREWIGSSRLNVPSGQRDIPPPTDTPSTDGTSYHAETRLKDGRSSLLLDIGSVGNLAGDEWVKHHATIAVNHNRKPEQYKRDRALNVSGVGNGSQSCEFNCKLPIAIPNRSGKFTKGSFDTPTVPKSMLPALLGLDSTRRCRGIIDTNTMVLHLCGPGDYDIASALPAGTESIQCEIAPSGHMVIPCSEFAELDKRERHGGLEIEHEVALPAVVEPIPTPLPYEELESLRQRCAVLERSVALGSSGSSSSGDHSRKRD